MEEKILITNVDDHAIKLVRNIASLFHVNTIDNKFSDVRIEVENTTFYCHKMILQLNSEFLGGLAFESGRELLQNIKPDVFYDVLQFVYTGEIYLSTDNVEFILSAAHRFGMDNLKKVCFRFLNMKLNLNTVQLFDRLATDYNNNDLKRKCKKLIKSEFAKLQSSKTCKMFRLTQ